MAAKWKTVEELAEAIDRAEGVDLERIKVRVLLQLAMSLREISHASQRLSLIAPVPGEAAVVVPPGLLTKIGHG